MAVDILNAVLILLKKESNRYEHSRDQVWNHLQQLTPKGIDLLEEAFKPINPAMFKIHITEMDNHHAATVSKESASKREYTVIIPKADNMGSIFGMCTWWSKKEGIPCQHMVALVKLGRIDGLSRIGIMSHWYTTAQWRNQFPKDAIIGTHITLKSIKANSTPEDNIHYCSTWAALQKKGQPKKEMRRKSIADNIKQSVKKKRRTKKTTKTPEEEQLDLESKDMKDGQEGKA
jgi:hypothetical protein